jgi:hypothetical protein
MQGAASTRRTGILSEYSAQALFTSINAEEA